MYTMYVCISTCQNREAFSCMQVQLVDANYNKKMLSA